MKINIIMKRAVPKDAIIISRIASKTFLETYYDYVEMADLLGYMEQSFNINLLSKEIADKKTIFILVMANEKTIGYAKLNKDKKPRKLKESKSIEIERIYLLKNFTNKGIGTKIVSKCLSIARDCGAKVVWLGVWEKNVLAINFYKKMGFRYFGSSVFRLGKTKHRDILFKKVL